MRNYPKGNLSFTDFLKKVKDNTLHAFENQSYQFEKLVEKVQPNRDLSRMPLFDTMFILQNMNMDLIAVKGLTLTPKDVKKNETQYDLSFYAKEEYKTEEHKTISFQIEYCTKLFKRETIIKLKEHYVNLLEAFSETPKIVLAKARMLTVKEEEKILVDFNKTKVNFQQEQTIHGLFAEQVKQKPEDIAIIFSGQSMTYRELDEKSSLMAKVLQKKGVKADTIVAIMVERSFEMMIGILASLKSGGAYLPISPDYPADRIQFMLEDGNVKVLMIRKPSQLKIRFVGEIVSFDDPSLYQDDNGVVQTNSKSKDLAYVIYTSGSTGKPKGVMIEHRAFINFVAGMVDKIAFVGGKTMVALTTISFDIFTLETLLPLICGMKIVIADEEQQRDPQLLNELMSNHPIDMLQVVPSRLRMLVENSTAAPWLRNLKEILVGGEAFPQELLVQLKKICQAKIYNMYGPTETTVWSCVKELTQTDKVTIGTPIANTQIYILDSQLNPLPIKAIGELYISGEGLARGYQNRLELTKERFVENPFFAGTRMYRTGDLARWETNGELTYMGRIDHQVKIRGFRIELGEIETQLQNHPLIKQVLVTEYEDSLGGKQLCAYYIAKQAIAISKLREYLSAALPDYMIPAFYVPLDEFVQLPNGKINRKALPRPDDSSYTETVYAKPENDLEEILVPIWQEILGLEQIGIDDNFFHLGGDSIKAMQILSRLETYNLKIKMKHLFQAPTIRCLVPFVSATKAKNDQGIVTGEIGLTPIQMNFFEQVRSGQHHYNQSLMLYNELGFDAAVVRKVTEQLWQHHDALRMVFTYKDKKIIQYNRDLSQPVFELKVIHTLHSIAEEVNQIQQGINLSKGSLFQTVLFQSDQGDRLLFVVHHLVVDAVSFRILIEDFIKGYQMETAGQRMQLPAKTDSYKKWSEQLYIYANQSSLLKDITYWKELEKKQIHSLPKAHQISIRTYSDMEKLTFGLTKIETEQMQQEIERVFRITVHDALLMALGMALKKWTGDDLLLVDVEGHGREEIVDEIDVNRTVGWFTSLYPVVLEFSGAKDLSDEIKQMKENLNRIPHHGISYGILKYLTAEDNKSELTFKLNPEVLFNYLGQFNEEDDLIPIKVSDFSTEPNISAECTTQHSIEVLAQLISKELTITVSYSKAEYEASAAHLLLEYYQQSLTEIIEYCTQKRDTQYSPSDFGDDELSIEEFDDILDYYESKN
jgi:amino acid adenylation domain-containing protein/non-ribosomal peptide synthase protein (TIGR01720 family)